MTVHKLRRLRPSGVKLCAFEAIKGLEVLFTPAKVKVLDYDCDMFFLTPERLVVVDKDTAVTVLLHALALLDKFSPCKGSDGLCEITASLNYKTHLEVASLFQLWLNFMPLPAVVCMQHGLTEFYHSPSFWVKCRRAWLVKQIEILKA